MFDRDGVPEGAFTIAIDGPAGSGKSSAARGVARALGVDYIDTGAMYRALTWWMLEHGIDPADSDRIASHALDPDVSITWDVQHPLITVDGVDVTADIRSDRVSAAVSQVSAIPQIRQRLVALQRDMVGESIRSGRGVVMEGRDIGTVVLPDATLKVFLTADVRIRAERRAAENSARHPASDTDHFSTALENLTDRDSVDTNRDASPLTMAVDAVIIDASHLSLDQVVAQIVSLVKERGR
jgi:cytidylate kinase